MDTVKFWAVFAVGVAAGAAVALIYAPQPGAKTRKQLRRKLNDATDYVKDVSGDLSDRAGDAVSRGRDVVEDLVNSAQRASQTVAKKVSDLT
jgi:gas vesicle protein